MRKLLSILLIATIACNGVYEKIEHFNEDMIFDFVKLDEDDELANIRGKFDPLKNTLLDKMIKFIYLLNEKELFEQFVSIYKTNNKLAVKVFCKKFNKPNNECNFIEKYFGFYIKLT